MGNIGELNGEIITAALTDQSVCRKIFVFDSLSSTNDKAKSLAKDGEGSDLPENFAVLAKTQTEGRGTKGRSWSSPPGGLYLSVCLQKAAPPSAVGLVTAYAAVAVRKTLSDLCGIDAKIKWVNDIVCSDKKLCGILCESFDNPRGERSLIVGIGINLTSAALPDGLKSTAAALSDLTKETPLSQNALAAGLLHNLSGISDETSLRGCLPDYRLHSSLLGRQVTVTDLSNPESKITATAVDIDKNANLLILDQNGETHILNSARYSVAPLT